MKSAQIEIGQVEQTGLSEPKLGPRFEIPSLVQFAAIMKAEGQVESPVLPVCKDRVSSKSARRNERGQAMTEYLFLVVLCGLVCIPMVKALPQAVRGYLRPFYYCISRPIP